MLGADLGTDLRRSALGLVLGADLGTGFDRHKKSRHQRCLPVDQKLLSLSRSSLIDLAADHTHQNVTLIIDPDKRTAV